MRSGLAFMFCSNSEIGVRSCSGGSSMGLKKIGISCVMVGALLAGTVVAPETKAPRAGITATSDTPFAAPAGHGGEEKHVDFIKSQIDPPTIIATIAIFVCLLVVLRLTAWKPILAGLKSRAQAIRDSI